MTAQPGSRVLIKAGNGGSPETFAVAGGLRTTRFVLNNRRIDASTVSSGAWRRLLAAGMQSITLSATGIFTDAVSEETLRSQAFAGSINNYEFDFGDNDTFSGAFQITAYERAGDHDAEETYAITFESAGPITVTLG